MKLKTALSLALKKPPRTSDEFEKLPKHVAIIMDGNGRWAKKHKLNVSKGHRQGTETLREIIRHTDDLGIGAYEKVIAPPLKLLAVTCIKDLVIGPFICCPHENIITKNLICGKY